MSRLLPLMFEDHTVAGFRPVAWSIPVGELRCGILNPRERLAQLAGRQPILLLRGFLQQLARDVGHDVGAEAVRQALAGSGITDSLWISPRVGHHWALLHQAMNDLGPGEALVDDEGLLAARVPRDQVEDWLQSWQRWNEAAATTACWCDPAQAVPRWEPPLAAVDAGQAGWRRIWDLMPATAEALASDLEQLAGVLPERRIWGAIPVMTDYPEAWMAAAPLRRASEIGRQDLVAGGDPADVWLAPGCRLAAGTAIDASSGPVVLGAGVKVLPHCYLEGPLYVGAGSVIKAGATIYGETSLGAVNKVAGEIGESTFLDFVNKQHEGFIGHAYLGSWSNLGALTTNSDLKNTYGTIRVDLGSGAEDTGLRFIGLMMGEHGKTAIGTMFNTGTTVGFASNVFGSGFPAKCLPNWTWGDGSSSDRQDRQRAMATAETVMSRRGCRLTPGHEEIFRTLG